jgi:hypothetical protein
VVEGWVSRASDDSVFINTSRQTPQGHCDAVMRSNSTDKGPFWRNRSTTPLPKAESWLPFWAMFSEEGQPILWPEEGQFPHIGGSRARSASEEASVEGRVPAKHTLLHTSIEALSAYFAMQHRLCSRNRARYEVPDGL